MNKLAILVFVAFLLIVSSSFAASLQKSTTAAKTCSPELFKEKPGLCAAIYALAHNKESSASAEKRAAEKPSETSTIISAPIEVKKGPTMEQKKASAGECPAGQAKDCAGICFPLKECKASISAQPATCTQSEEEKTSAMMTAEKLGLKSLPHLRILCQRIAFRQRRGVEIHFVLLLVQCQIFPMLIKQDCKRRSK